MELRTSRLTIRPLEEGDWPALQEIWRDFARSPYHVYDRPLPTDAPGAQALARHFASTGLAFGVRLAESQALAGYVCFHREGEEYDLGYCFHSAYQGQGYAWESVSALLEYLDVYKRQGLPGPRHWRPDGAGHARPAVCPLPEAVLLLL